MLVKSLAALSFVPTDQVAYIFEILSYAFPPNNGVDIDAISSVTFVFRVNVC